VKRRRADQGAGSNEDCLLAWSKAKALLREAAARTPQTLLKAVTRALRAITPQGATGWFRHCGYHVASE
jgi:hypothetical protein